MTWIGRNNYFDRISVVVVVFWFFAFWIFESAPRDSNISPPLFIQDFLLSSLSQLCFVVLQQQNSEGRE